MKRLTRHVRSWAPLCAVMAVVIAIGALGIEFKHWLLGTFQPIRSVADAVYRGGVLVSLVVILPAIICLAIGAIDLLLSWRRCRKPIPGKRR